MAGHRDGWLCLFSIMANSRCRKVDGQGGIFVYIIDVTELFSNFVLYKPIISIGYIKFMMNFEQ